MLGILPVGHAEEHSYGFFIGSEAGLMPADAGQIGCCILGHVGTPLGSLPKENTDPHQYPKITGMSPLLEAGRQLSVGEWSLQP